MSNTQRIRLKYIANVQMGQSPPSVDYTNIDDGIPFLQGTAEFGDKYPIAKIYSLNPNKICNEGDILFSVRAPVGEINISNYKYGIGRGLCAIRGNNSTTNNFLWWALHHERRQLKFVETGTTYSAVSAQDVENILITKLSPKDQLLVNNFLSKETEQIDNLISLKKRLLSSLSEKRQALITNAVTNGIHSNTKMKDSNIDWLGKIPEHWQIKKIKYVTTKIGSGVTPKGGATVYQKYGIPLLRSQNIHFAGLELKDVAFISEEIHESMSNSKVFSGDVLLNITGASIGRCYYYKGELGEANVNQHVCILRPNEKIISEYLYLLISSKVGQYQVSLHQVGGGREGLTFESIKSFILPIPKIQEQQKILEHVKKYDDEIKLLETLTKESLELLKERRASLITAAVTGQFEIPS